MNHPEDMSGGFETVVTLIGPERQPHQMLDQQSYDGHASIHDEDTAGVLGLAGAPIEGPTHFSQIDPLAATCFGRQWFESGCISAHFQTMVVQGESVVATLTRHSARHAGVVLAKADGTPVLLGSASVAPHPLTELERRVAHLREPGELFIVDRLEIGQSWQSREPAFVDMETDNGALYPFSLSQKLEYITESSTWYSSDETPWGRAILPFEMISVLAAKSGGDFPVRGPSLGLFLDLEIRLVNGPVFVGEQYDVHREVVAVSQSRRTESYWTRTTLTSTETRDVAAVVLLHSGVFKESYAQYPREKL